MWMAIMFIGTATAFLGMTLATICAPRRHPLARDVLSTGNIARGQRAVNSETYPPLSIARTDSVASLSWVTPETGIILQQADLLITPVAWSDTTNSITINGLTNTVQQPIANGINSRFYRLRRP
jgi:hypothetical protein